MKLSVLCLAGVLIAGPVAAVAQDMDTTFQALKDAESKKDAAEVKKLAAEASKLARQAIAEAAPTNPDEKVAWKQHLDYAKSIDEYSEYALYAVAVQSQPATMVDLISALEKQNPKSKYLDQAYGYYFGALSQTGASAKVPEIAEKALANFPDNEDLLAVMAGTAQGRKQPDRALAYANRLVAACNKHTKAPEGMAAAEWERRHTAMLGRGYYIAGVVAAEQNRFPVADKNLRSALPFIKADPGMMGTALFYLGVANYQLGKIQLSKAKILEGANYSDQASKLAGPFQEQAWKNAQIMRTEAGKMR